MNELLDPREDWRRHHHLPDAGHVLAVVVAHQGKHPDDHLRETFLRHSAGHDTHRLGLLGHWYPLSHDAVEVSIFLAKMKVEMELECGRSTRCLQRVIGRKCRVHSVKGGIQAAVIPLIGLSYQWRHGFNRWKDGQLLAVGMPDQDFVEESVTLNGRTKPRLAAGSVERGSIDYAHVVPEGIMNRHNCIQWFCHISFLLVLSDENLNDPRVMLRAYYRSYRR